MTALVVAALNDGEEGKPLRAPEGFLPFPGTLAPAAALSATPNSRLRCERLPRSR